MLDDFLKAREISKKISFEALIMAAVRVGSLEQIAKLRKVFDELVTEVIARGNTTDGKLS